MEGTRRDRSSPQRRCAFQATARMVTLPFPFSIST
jgi:hypothetical protein